MHSKDRKKMQCLVCGKTDASLCTGCKRVAYCGTLCQAADWTGRHRLVCNGPALDIEPIAGTDDQNQSKEDIPPGGGVGPGGEKQQEKQHTQVTVTASGYALEVADRVSVSLTAETRSLSMDEPSADLMARHKARIKTLEYLLSGYTAKDVNVRLTEQKDKDYVKVVARAATSYWTIELTDASKRYDTVKMKTTVLATAAEYKEFIASVVAAGALVSNVSMYLSRRASSQVSKRAIQNAIVAARDIAEEIAETMRGTVERTVKIDVQTGASPTARYSERAISASFAGGGKRDDADIPGQLEEVERAESVTIVYAVSEGSALDRKYKQPKK